MEDFDVKNLLNTIKNKQVYEVESDLPETFRFSGRVPFDMVINGNHVIAKVLASNLEEAQQHLDYYLMGW